MADKSISELVAATQVQAADLFVLEQGGSAKKLTGQILENWLVSFADGHGGIQSIVYTAPASGSLTGSMLITMADTTTVTVPVTNGRSITGITWAESGTSGDGQTHTGTIAYNDGTTSTVTIKDGVKGDQGDAWYVHIKYAGVEPTSDADMGDNPDDWMGVYSGTSETAPTSYTAYEWFNIKGETGDEAELVSSVVTYQSGSSEIPVGVWTDEVPGVAQGDYLWTRTVLTFNNGDPVTFYTKSRQGVDGLGAAGESTPLPNTNAGAVGTSTSFAREDHRHPFPERTLTVSSSSSADIVVNDNALQTINRATAKLYGNMVVFSFVATVTSSGVNPATMLFQVSEDLMPTSQVDFVLLSSANGVLGGQLVPTSSYGNRIINTPSTLSGSGNTIRAEVVWIIG